MPRGSNAAMRRLAFLAVALLAASLPRGQEPSLRLAPDLVAAPGTVEMHFAAPPDAHALVLITDRGADRTVVLPGIGGALRLAQPFAILGPLRGGAAAIVPVPQAQPAGPLHAQALVLHRGRLWFDAVATATVVRLSIQRVSRPRPPQGEWRVNVGQHLEVRAVLEPAPLAGAATFTWRLHGPHLREYREDVAAPFRTVAMQPADYRNQDLACYLLPAAIQRHPFAIGPLPRLVAVRADLRGARFHAHRLLEVERNTRHADLQAEDFYVEYNHVEAQGHGMPPTRVLNEHAGWHVQHDWLLFPECGPQVRGFAGFLDFHHRFQERFAAWRETFGFPPLQPWDPGTPIPRGPLHDHAGRSTGDPLYPLPGYLRVAGGTVASKCFRRTSLLEFRDLAELSVDTFEPWHNGVHARVGGDMGHHATSPKDPAFWRFHEFLDREVYQRWLSHR